MTGTPETPILEVEGLSAGYGDMAVLRGLSFTVAPGQVLCITGRNGVGKTTLMRTVAGFLPPLGGTMRLAGQNLALQDLAGLAPHRRHALGLAYAPQDEVTFAPLTLRENLTLHRDGHDLGVYAGLFARFPRIAERLDQTAGTLSGGERKILSFCRVMAEARRLTCLDEPTEGVQPENIDHMAAEIRTAAQAGRSVLLVEQNLSLVEAVADQVLVLDHGAIVLDRAAGPSLRAAITEKLKV